MSLYKLIRCLRSFPPLTSRPNACACTRLDFFSAKAPSQKIVKEVDPITGEIKSKKSPQVIPKVTLLNGDSINITTLTEAQKLAKRRDLKLVKIVDLDAKSQRPVYKLMSGSEYLTEDLKQREQRKKDKSNVYIKGEKVLLLNSRISSHDLETSLRKALKWITKSYEVRVVISGANSGGMEVAEQMFLKFEEFFKNEANSAKIVQKRNKGSEVKFQILPPKKSDNDSEKNSPDPNKDKEDTDL